MTENKLNNTDTNNSVDNAISKSHDHVGEVTKKGSKKRKWFAILFILANLFAIGLTVGLEFGNTGTFTPPAVIFSTWGENFIFIVYALLGIIAFLLLDAIKYMVMFKSTIGKFRVKDSVKVAILGKYYDNITPLGSGGQPFQVHYLAKHNVPAGVATATPVASFFFTQFAFMVCSVVVFIANPSAVDPAIKVISYIGSFFAFIVPLAIVIFSIFPKTTWKIVNFFITLVYKMRIIKNLETTREKVQKYVYDYTSSLRAVNKNAFVVIAMFILSCGMQIALCSIPYFVIRACGVANANWFDLLTMTLCVYCSISFIPTPGNAGAAEGAFGIVFAGLKSLSEGSFLFYGTMLWRVTGYYSTILFGIIVIILNSIRRKRLQPNLLASVSKEQKEE